MKTPKNTTARNAKAPAVTALKTVTAPAVIDGKAEVVGSELSAEKKAKVAEYSQQIGASLQSASIGLRDACLLAYKASEDGCFVAVMEELHASGQFAKATLDGLSTAVTRVIPFTLQQGGDIKKLGSIDGMRELLPKVATLDKASGKFTVNEGAGELVKRALAGESPRKLVNEMKAASEGGESTGGGSSSNMPFRIGKLASSIKSKHDAEVFARNAGKAAALGGLTLEKAIEKLTAGYGQESEAILAREQREEAAKVKAEEKKQAAKAKKAEKKAAPKAAKAPKLGKPKVKK